MLNVIDHYFSTTFYYKKYNLFKYQSWKTQFTIYIINNKIIKYYIINTVSMQAQIKFIYFDKYRTIILPIQTFAY